MKPEELIVEVYDAASMRTLSERLSQGNAHVYRLRDPASAPQGPMALSRHVLRSAGELRVNAVAERRGTVVGIMEPGTNKFCFCDLRSGAMAMSPPAATEPSIGSPGRGLIHGGEGGLHALPQDGTARTNLWVSRARMETALAEGLEGVPRERLRFDPLVDWSAPGPGAVRRLLLHAEAEFAREDGMAAHPVALAAFTDLFVQTALRELSHNHRERFLRPANAATPAHLRRAEAFMREYADAPIGLAEIAAAAGCGVRTLHNLFRQFRGTTPHRALQTVRLERAHDELRRGEAPVAVVARRFGFTHAGRFTASYVRIFGEKPRRG